MLSQFEGDVHHNVTIKYGSGLAKPLYTDVPVQIGYSQLQREKEEKGKATMESAEEMESLLWKLEVANKDRDEARAELEALRRTLRTVDDTVWNENTMSWLGSLPLRQRDLDFEGTVQVEKVCSEVRRFMRTRGYHNEEIQESYRRTWTGVRKGDHLG